MRSYENVFVMVPTLDNDGFQAEIESYKKFLGTQGVTITTEKEWGRRRLAYPIRDHSEGIFRVPAQRDVTYPMNSRFSGFGMVLNMSSRCSSAVLPATLTSGLGLL